MTHTAPHLRRELHRLAHPEFRATQQRFFREPVRSLGVRTPEIRAIARAACREYRRARIPLPRIWDVCDQLWRGRWLEERALAVSILGKFRSRLSAEDWPRLDEWVGSLRNWAETDGLCIELLAPLLKREPALVRRLMAWTRGPARFRRRAVAVALVPLARHGDQLDAAFRVCDRLAGDRDDLVEKAIGWLLKEASRTQPNLVTAYLSANRSRLSRSTLRYACEKLPEKLSAQVLRRGEAAGPSRPAAR